MPGQAHSLRTGWRWSKKADGPYALDIDGHHANVAGQYLGGLVFFKALYGKSVVGLSFRPNGINAEYARFLQETARRIAARSERSNVKAGARPTRRPGPRQGKPTD